MRRPAARGGYASTPSAANLIDLLGGMRTHAVTISVDEHTHLARLYGYTKEPPHEKPPPPTPPRREDFKTSWAYDHAVTEHKAALKLHETWEDPRPMHQAGADRNMMREAGADGLRMAAWIARYLEPGDDPVRALVELAIEAGWDVDAVDVEWVHGAGDESAEGETP